MPRKVPWILLAAGLVALLVYAPGQFGPFVLDDAVNLAPVFQWTQGERHWAEVVFSNQAGLFGRAIPMASFLLSASLNLPGALGFKATNLLLHLASGLVAWALLRRLIRRDPNLSSRADIAAALVATLWLLHPINASTVLYVVQRMAQFSAIFTMVCLWLYASARGDLTAGRNKRAWLKLFFLFPTVLMAGVSSKENAAVAPLLCLILEFAYFGRERQYWAPLGAFFALFLVLPSLGIAWTLWSEPNVLLGTYALRDFDLLQRLMTEARILVHYIGQILVPDAPRMGLYWDDFVPSTGLLQPATTILSIMALGVTSLAALCLRGVSPTLFAGWFIFLGGHAVESTILPLELYFEHRNYLPSLGLLLAAIAAIELVSRPFHQGIGGRLMRPLATLLAATAVLTLALLSHGRALAWQDRHSLVADALRAHPHSFRANLDQATIGLQTGRYSLALDSMERLAGSANPRHRFVAHAGSMSVDCLGRGRVTTDGLAAMDSEPIPFVTLSELEAYRLLARISLRACGPQLSAGRIARSAEALLYKTATQPASMPPRWMLAMTTAELWLRADQPERAVPLAEYAWQASRAPEAHALLARSQHAASSAAGEDTVIAVGESRPAPASSKTRNGGVNP